MKPDQTFKLFQFLLSYKAKKLDNKSKLLLVTLHAASNIFRHSNNFSIFDFKLDQITYPIPYALKVFKQWYRLGVTSEIAAQDKMAELKRKFDNTARSYCEQLLSQD